MPIRGGWLLRPHVFVIHYQGRVTDAAFIEGGSHPVVLAAMDDPAVHAVHFIHEALTDDTVVPSIQAIARTPVARHPKLGWSLNINFQHNSLARMTIAIAAQLLHARVRDVADYDEALAWIRQVDTTVPSVPAGVPDGFNNADWPGQDGCATV